MKHIGPELLAELERLKDSINEKDQKEIIDLIIKIIKGGDNAPPLKALSDLVKKSKRKPTVYVVTDIICRIILKLFEHKALEEGWHILQEWLKHYK